MVQVVCVGVLYASSVHRVTLTRDPETRFSLLVSSFVCFLFVFVKMEMWKVEGQPPRELEVRHLRPAMVYVLLLLASDMVFIARLRKGIAGDAVVAWSRC